MQYHAIISTPIQIKLHKYPSRATQFLAAKRPQAFEQSIRIHPIFSEFTYWQFKWTHCVLKQWVNSEKIGWLVWRLAVIESRELACSIGVFSLKICHSRLRTLVIINAQHWQKSVDHKRIYRASIVSYYPDFHPRYPDTSYRIAGGFLMGVSLNQPFFGINPTRFSMKNQFSLDFPWNKPVLGDAHYGNPTPGPQGLPA
jgi:hypothetical protein